jgi:hypothetical protein
MRAFNVILLLLILGGVSYAKEWHVSVKGDDTNDGTAAKPLRNISAAAQIAFPGDTITVHEGTYRERVTPPRGGTEGKPIVYRAAPGEKAVIKGSEVIKTWKQFMPNVWKLTLSNSFFGPYNPYKDLVAGDWFTDRGRAHHTGEVYLNGKSLWESHILERVLNPQPIQGARDEEGSSWPWYCETDSENTYIYANFHGKNPNDELVEINVRDSCFYPDQPGRNYITVQGFRLCQAATQWAPPTAEQIGLIGTHWSKGWVIENNVISDSKCSGITLGKDRLSGHNVWTADPSKDGATHYTEVIARALQEGWSRANIGSHIVQSNTIFNCEQAGICGSLGGAFSQIIGNHIYNIWDKRLFAGSEIAGIKLHAPIDAIIKNNRIHNTGRGMWMDWMAQGTRISGNLLYDNTADDLFIEVNHGPFIVDNNLFLSGFNLRDWSECGAYAHNLFAGVIESRPEPKRLTPFQAPHGTKVTGFTDIKGGGNRFYNNVFVRGAERIIDMHNWDRNNPQRYIGFGTWMFDARENPSQAAGNLYFPGTRAYSKETNASARVTTDVKLSIAEDGDGLQFRMTPADPLPAVDTVLVTSELLGKAEITGLRFEQPDSSPIRIDTDYFGRKRNASHPAPGPFEGAGIEPGTWKVW